MKYIGIDLGGTNIALGITDASGRILSKMSIPTNAREGFDAIVSRMADAAHCLVRQSGSAWDDIAYVGVGSPGGVDKASGVVISACNLGFDRVPLAERLSSMLNKTVYVENDANCAALAEAKVGAAKDSVHSVMITLGTGIGGGIIIDGKLYGGINNFGGEFGHMVICDGGEACACGKSGCFETYASATALARETRKAAEKNTASLLWKCVEPDGAFSGRSAFRAAEQGDAVAAEVIDRYITYLAIGVTNIIKIFQPTTLVVGGGVSNAGEALFTPLRAKVDAMAYRPSVPRKMRTAIKAAALGNDAGIIGAALLGM